MLLKDKIYKSIDQEEYSVICIKERGRRWKTLMQTTRKVTWEQTKCLAGNHYPCRKEIPGGMKSKCTSYNLGGTAIE